MLSCSTAESPIWSQAQQTLSYSDKVLQYELHQVHLDMQEISKTKTHYQVLLQPKDTILSLKKRLLTQIDSLSNLETYTLQGGKTLLQLVQQTRDSCLAHLLGLWDNGGIKGTIFADTSRRATQRNELEKLVLPLNLVIQDSIQMLQSFRDNDEEKIAQYFVMITNVSHLVSFGLIQYLMSQISYMHFYPTHPVIHWHLPRYLYSNQSLTTAILLQKTVLDQDFSTWINHQPILLN